MSTFASVSPPRPGQGVAVSPDETSNTSNLAALFRAHGRTVARWAARLGGPAVDAEDVVQEVFLIANRRLTDFTVEQKVRTWLFRTTEGVVRHHRRKYRWRRSLRGSAEDVAGGMDSPGPSALEILERNEDIALAYRILNSLGEAHRTVLVLFEVEGLTGAEIATLTETRTASVWVRLHRARAEFAARALKIRGNA